LTFIEKFSIELCVTIIITHSPYSRRTHRRRNRSHSGWTWSLGHYTCLLRHLLPRRRHLQE